MSPAAWVRSHPGGVVSALVILLALFLVRVVPVSGAEMLGSVNVVQMLGIILAGQLAVLALTVPALFEVKEAVFSSRFAEDSELLDMVGGIAKELKSNTFWTFLMFGAVFLVGVLYDPNASSLGVKLPLGYDLGMVFSALKISCVTLSCLAMWDSVEPLFNLGEITSLLKRDTGYR